MKLTGETIVAAANQARSLRRSQELLKRAQQVLPVGAQTFSKSPMVYVQGVAPNFVNRAQGAYVWDVDGNRYVDHVMGLGAVTLGHAYPAVNEAVKAQIDEGFCYSLPHPLEVEVAELLRGLIPCAEMARYGKNGSDATSAAVRLARACTGRDKILCSGYHGWQDWYIGATTRNKGVPQAVRNLTTAFAYNDLPALHKLFDDNRGSVACVIMEPLCYTEPKEGYLQGVKELCRRNGVLLIFDEVLIGFRMNRGGAHSLYGVDPDLATFGKAMANGFPMSAVVGRAEIMRLFEEAFFSSTFGGDTIGLCACKATIAEMAKHEVIAHIARIGDRLKRETNRLAAAAGLTGRVECLGPAPLNTIAFRDETGASSMLLKSLWQQEVLKRGVLTLGNHAPSFSHDDAAVEQTLRAYVEAFEILADAIRRNDVEQRLEGPPIQPVFRQV